MIRMDWVGFICKVFSFLKMSRFPKPNVLSKGVWTLQGLVDPPRVGGPSKGWWTLQGLVDPPRVGGLPKSWWTFQEFTILVGNVVLFRNKMLVII